MTSASYSLGEGRLPSLNRRMAYPYLILSSFLYISLLPSSSHHFSTVVILSAQMLIFRDKSGITLLSNLAASIHCDNTSPLNFLRVAPAITKGGNLFIIGAGYSFSLPLYAASELCSILYSASHWTQPFFSTFSIWHVSLFCTSPLFHRLTSFS